MKRKGKLRKRKVNELFKMKGERKYTSTNKPSKNFMGPGLREP